MISARFIASSETWQHRSRCPPGPFPADGPARPPTHARAAVAWAARPDDPARQRVAPGERLGLAAGPATVALTQDGESDPGRGVGTGCRRALDGVPALLGLDADADEIPSGHPLVAQLARRFPGVRIPRSGAVLDALVPAILEQKVTGEAARRAWPGLIRVYGEARAGTGRVAPPSPARPVGPGRPPLLRLPPVRGRAAAGRPHPAGRVAGGVVRGDRGPATRRRPTRG